MKLFFTGRHFEVTKAIKDFTLEKLKNHLKFMRDIMEVHVILSIEKYRHNAEITIKGKKAAFSGKGETGDMYSSITAGMEKIEKQAKKRKEKFTARKRKGNSTERSTSVYNPEEEPSKDEEFAPSIVKVESQEAKPMTVEEAALQMESANKDLLVFRNFDSKKINVMYRRKNGDLGLIEPES